MFSSREIATGIWLVLLLASALTTKADARQALARLLVTLVRPKIVVPVVLVGAYTAGVVYILSNVGLWTPNLLKDTILWFLLTGLAVATTAVASQTPNQVIRSSLRDSLKVVVFLEFLVNAHTFSLPAELLLVPIVSLVVMLDAVARTDEKYSDAARLLSWVQVVFGFGILMSALSWAAANHTTLLSLDGLRDVALGPILSVMFIPATYTLVLYANYEIVFMRLDMGRGKERALVRYAKWKMLQYAHLRLSRVLELTRRASDIVRIARREDVDELIQLIEAEGPSDKRVQRTQKSSRFDKTDKRRLHANPLGRKT